MLMHSKSLAILFSLFGVDNAMIIIVAALQETVKSDVTISWGEKVYELKKPDEQV